MYEHHIQSFGKWEKVEVSNPATGCRFSVVPGKAACVLDIVLQGQSVLDGYATPEELDFNHWGKSMVLFPFPNRLKDGEYEWEGATYSFPVNDPLTGNALHGFSMETEMILEELDLKNHSAYLQCRYEHDGETPGYPFPFTFFIGFTIKDPNQFEVKMIFENDGIQDIPVGLGWHPYFRVSEKADQMELKLPPCRMIGVDERMIPTGKRYLFDDFQHFARIGANVLDNCFELEDTVPKAELFLKGSAGTLHFWQETGEGKFNFFQLFTPSYRDSLAIEPMTCNIDAFHNGDGLGVLEPGERMEACFGFSLIPDADR